MSSSAANGARPGCWPTATGVSTFLALVCALVCALVSAFFLVLAPVAVGHADPGPSEDTTAPPAAEQPPAGEQLAPESAPAATGAPNPAAADACRQFAVALDHAAANYEDFAYNTAGSGNYVDYADPIVANSNIVGRTALREAAATALDASMTPGLLADIASPMQSWSLRATKLLLSMGLHSGGDSLNSTANALNKDAHDVQMACAIAGSRA
jgi:hypothetical protein